MSDGITEMYQEERKSGGRMIATNNPHLSNVSDGSTATYYELPSNSRQLQDLISHKNMNAQIGEIFRECYRYGQAAHCDQLRGIKKILFYANAELKRLSK